MRQVQPFGPLDAAIEAALEASIKRFGVIVPVIKDQDGATLDGHHRVKIAKRLGATYDTITIICRDDEHRLELARTLNADRRQLTPEQRREVSVALRQEGHSLRAIGGALGVDEGTVRNDLKKATAEDSAVDLPSTVTGLDGKVRPARATERTQLGPPSRGMQLARIAIMNLDEISADDVERDAALQTVAHALSDLGSKAADVTQRAIIGLTVTTAALEDIPEAIIRTHIGELRKIRTRLTRLINTAERNDTDSLAPAGEVKG